MLNESEELKVLKCVTRPWNVPVGKFWRPLTELIKSMECQEYRDQALETRWKKGSKGEDSIYL